MEYRPARWEMPIDLETELKAVPKTTTISGAMIGQTVAAAKALGVSHGCMRDRYAAHQKYPLSEHVTLLIEMIPIAFPQRTGRHALRSMGRAAIDVYLESLLGRVTVGSTDDVELMLQNVVRSYALNISGARATLLSLRAGEAEILLEHVPYFLDSHHIGILEGCIRRCGVKPVVEVAPIAWDSAAFRCSF